MNFINEPHLFITFNTGKGVPFYTHLTDDPNGPLEQVTLSDGDSAANIPTKQLGLYIQDDWRVTNRVTLNLGLRYDFVSGVQIDQSLNPNFVKMQEAGAAGRFSDVIGWEHFGETPEEDRDNIQPRVGGVLDLRGDGRDVVRAGWGIYTDFGYTNSNVLFAAADASGNGFGAVFRATDTDGLRNPDGSLYQSGQPLSNLASLNEVAGGSFPLFGQMIDPRLEQPETMQTSVGWSHELSATTVVSADYVHIDGRKLNLRPRLNVLLPDGTRRFTDVGLKPNSSATRAAISRGKSKYDALILAIRRRLSSGVDFNASYTLSRALSTIGTASDELDARYVQDAFNPFDDPRMLGPTRRTDARHRLTLSATAQLTWQIRIAPIVLFRSALPVYISEGVDLDGDGELNDLPERAYAFTGFDADGHATFKDVGACETINCGRGAVFSQMNLRVSKVFRFAGRIGVEAIGEIFNVFNAQNPAGFERGAAIPQSQRLISGEPNPEFMSPSFFAVTSGSPSSGSAR